MFFWSEQKRGRVPNTISDQYRVRIKYSRNRIYGPKVLSQKKRRMLNLPQSITWNLRSLQPSSDRVLHRGLELSSELHGLLQRFSRSTGRVFWRSCLPRSARALGPTVYPIGINRWISLSGFSYRSGCIYGHGSWYRVDNQKLRHALTHTCLRSVKILSYRAQENADCFLTKL